MAIIKYELMNDILNTPATNFTPAPDGDYTLLIESVDAGAAKNAVSYRVIVNFTIVGANYQGRKFFEVYTVDNPKNREAQNISRVRFNKLLAAVKVTGNQDNKDFDTDQLIGKTFNAHLIIEDSQDEYGPRNHIQYFLQ